jgi:hypothetical protein
MTYARPHDCPYPAAPRVAKQLEANHRTQAGVGKVRHKCTACAYHSGFEAGERSARSDRRKRTWTLKGDTQLCAEGSAAPVTKLSALPPTEGRHRWHCVVCAWSLGWCAGVASGLK